MIQKIIIVIVGGVATVLAILQFVAQRGAPQQGTPAGGRGPLARRE